MDRDGKSLMDGGGTLVLKGYENVRGPGHNAVLHDGDTDYLIHHWYDASHRGRRSLGVRPIVWDADGWPLPGELLAQPKQPSDKVAGDWLISIDFADAHAAKLTADDGKDSGHIDGDRGTWRVRGDALELHLSDRRAPDGESIITATLAADKSWFVGRDRTGQIVRGRRGVE